MRIIQFCCTFQTRKLQKSVCGMQCNGHTDWMSGTHTNVKTLTIKKGTRTRKATLHQNDTRRESLKRYCSMTTICVLSPFHSKHKQHQRPSIRCSYWCTLDNQIGFPKLNCYWRMSAKVATWRKLCNAAHVPNYTLKSSIQKEHPDNIGPVKGKDERHNSHF